jgi:hypothetical protein
MRFAGQDVVPKGSVHRIISILLVFVLVAVFSLALFSSPVQAAPVIISSALPAAQISTPYSAVLMAVPLVCPCAWSITGGLLPPGLILNPASGTISGTPTTAGTYPFFVVVTDTTGLSGPASFSITVSKPPMVINTYSLPQAKEGTSYTTSFSATGGTYPYNWTITSGSLPPGLILDPSTGVISGIPGRGTAGTFSFTISVSDLSLPVMSTQKSFNIFIERGTYGATVSVSTGLAAGSTKIMVDGNQVTTLKGGESVNVVVDLGISKTVSVTPIIPHPTESGIRFKAAEESIAINQLNSSANFTYFTEYEVKLETAPVTLSLPGGSGWYRKDSNFTTTARGDIPGDPGVLYKFTSWLLPNSNRINTDNLSLTIDSPKTIVANYDTYFQLTVQSVNGRTEGAGWYKSGSEAKWNVANDQVPMPGLIGFFQGKYKAVNPSGTDVMNSPKTVTVLWDPNYFWPYFLIPLTIILLLGAAYGIYYFSRRNVPRAIQPAAPIPQVPQPRPIPQQHTTVVMIGGDQREKARELPVSTKEQLMASFGQLLEKYETEVKSTLAPKGEPKIDTIMNNRMLASPDNSAPLIVEGEIEQESQLCNHVSRKLLRTVTGQWRQANSSTTILPSEEHEKGKTESKTGLVVTWARDIFHEWEILTCSLPTAHNGKHKGSSEVVYSLMNMTTEAKTYGPGIEINPPAPHITDGMPEVEIDEDQVIPVEQLPGEAAI